jgi:hypothetical protein
MFDGRQKGEAGQVVKLDRRERKKDWTSCRDSRDRREEHRLQ